MTRAPSGGAVTVSRWLIQHVCSLGQPGEERAAAAVELGLAELGDAGALDLAAELERHQLHAVADAERRDAELEERRVDPRRVLGVDRRRAAAERISAAGLRAPHLAAAETCAGRAPSRRGTRGRGARSAARTGRRGRATSTGRSSGAGSGSRERGTTAIRAPVVRRLLRDRHVVRVALAQAGAGDPDEARVASSPRSSPRRSSPSPGAGRRRAGGGRPATGPLYGTRPSIPSGTSLSTSSTSPWK